MTSDSGMSFPGKIEHDGGPSSATVPYPDPIESDDASSPPSTGPEGHPANDGDADWSDSADSPPEQPPDSLPLRAGIIAMTMRYNALANRYIAQKTAMEKSGRSRKVVKALVAKSTEAILNANSAVNNATHAYCWRTRFEAPPSVVVRDATERAMLLTLLAEQIFRRNVDILEGRDVEGNEALAGTKDDDGREGSRRLNSIAVDVGKEEQIAHVRLEEKERRVAALDHDEGNRERKDGNHDMKHDDPKGQERSNPA